MSIEDKLLDVVKRETIPAVGCTEPIAVAYAASVAKKYGQGDLRSMLVHVSKGIFKNGKSVKIPNTELSGLDLAAMAGYLYGNSERELLVLESMTEEKYLRAKTYLDEGMVSLKAVPDVAPVYVELIAKADNLVSVTIEASHNHISKILVDQDIIFQEEHMDENHDDSFIKDLSFIDIRKIVENIDIERLDFIKDGIDMNLEAAKKGLSEDTGLKLGKTLKELIDQNIISKDSSTKARILTTAAADMRMGGKKCPIMTSAGSGNQGLSAILPIYSVWEDEGLEEEKLIRAVFFAHIINKYVKLYTGKLSYLCGCAIAAGMGASAGITWMLGGNDEQIAGASNNMLANLAGMICDGAKESCAFKLGTSSAEAVISAYLAVNNIITVKGEGIVGASVEDSVKNIGKLSLAGYPFMDPTIIDIIK